MRVNGDLQGGRKDEGCIFCLAAESGDDEARLVLHRGERCLVMLNAFRTTAAT